MIVGIGNDIIEIERVEKAISKEGFIAKVYTQREIENIVKRGNRAETYAGIFSAKEAISKAIGTGVRGSFQRAISLASLLSLASSL